LQGSDTKLVVIKKEVTRKTKSKFGENFLVPHGKLEQGSH